jgi:hypothetical protein
MPEDVSQIDFLVSFPDCGNSECSPCFILEMDSVWDVGLSGNFRVDVGMPQLLTELAVADL